MANMIELAVLPAHERLAELFNVSKERELTEAEQKEQEMCLQVNAKVFNRMTELKSMSLLAYQLNDVEWHHNVCADIEQFSKQFVRGGIYCG